jgi:Ran-binding protein 9/10
MANQLGQTLLIIPSFAGVAFRDVANLKDGKAKLYPSVGLKGSGDRVMVNFGQLPFVFDIDGYMKVSHHLISHGHANNDVPVCTGPYTSLAESRGHAHTDPDLEQHQQTMVFDNITEADTSTLSPPLNETELIQQLVSEIPRAHASHLRRELLT